MKALRALLLACLCVTSGMAPAAIVLLDLQGKGGAGLLAANENPVVTGSPGSGGEIGAGISFDDVSNLLTINVGWGTANGFTNLTGNATAMHIHQSTGFTTNGGVQLGLDSLAGYNNSSISGGFSGSVTLSGAQETALLAGLLYINVHTSTNSGGEIRGNLVVVPEPSRALLAGLGLVVLGFRRRR